MNIPILQALKRILVLLVQRWRKLPQRVSNLLSSPRTIVGQFANSHTIPQVKTITWSRSWMEQRAHLLSDTPQMEQLRNAAPSSNTIHWQLIEHSGHGRKFGRDIGVNSWITHRINLIAGKKHHAMNFIREIFQRKQRGCVIRFPSFGLGVQGLFVLKINSKSCNANSYQSANATYPGAPIRRIQRRPWDDMVKTGPNGCRENKAGQPYRPRIEEFSKFFHMEIIT